MSWCVLVFLVSWHTESNASLRSVGILKLISFSGGMLDPFLEWFGLLVCGVISGLDCG